MWRCRHARISNPRPGCRSSAGRTGGQPDDQGPGVVINDLLPDLLNRPVAVVLTVSLETDLPYFPLE